MRALPAIAIGVGLLAATGIYAKGLLQLKEHVKIKTVPRIVAAGFHGLVLGVQISITNPTTRKVRISPPQVTITYDGTELTSNIVPPSNEPGGDYTIKPKGSSQLAELRLSVPATTLLSLGQKLLAVATNPGTPLKIGVQVVTNLFVPPGIKKLIDTTQEFDLTRQQ